ncbi:MAG: hypothetical protein OEN56_02085 [Gemmatimonadota bacterium]|nr:hypothetical protein [Gemmatimonadota bacterium]
MTRTFGLLAVVLTLTAACTTYVVDTPPASLGAQLSVERFLQAANERDVRAMGRLFGTQNGAAMDTGSTFGCMFKKIGSWFGGSSCVRKQDVEVRMDAIASILQHQDYRVTTERRVAGRTAPTTRVLVDMTTQQGARVSALPFDVVQTGDGTWLIENVDLEMVMAAR